MKIGSSNAQTAVLQAVDEIVEEKLREGLVFRRQVTSGSMRFIIQPGDLVSVQWVDPAELHSGDIIVFRRKQQYVVHRIKRISSEPKSRIFFTQGDANTHPDRPVQESELLGKVIRIEKPSLTITLQQPSGRLLSKVVGFTSSVAFRARKLKTLLQSFVVHTAHLPLCAPFYRWTYRFGLLVFSRQCLRFAGCSAVFSRKGFAHGEWTVGHSDIDTVLVGGADFIHCSRSVGHQYRIARVFFPFLGECWFTSEEELLFWSRYGRGSHQASAWRCEVCEAKDKPLLGSSVFHPVTFRLDLCDQLTAAFHGLWKAARRFEHEIPPGIHDTYKIRNSFFSAIKALYYIEQQQLQLSDYIHGRKSFINELQASEPTHPLAVLAGQLQHARFHGSDATNCLFFELYHKLAKLADAAVTPFHASLLELGFVAVDSQLTVDFNSSIDSSDRSPVLSSRLTDLLTSNSLESLCNFLNKQQEEQHGENALAELLKKRQLATTLASLTHAASSLPFSHLLPSYSASNVFAVLSLEAIAVQMIFEQKLNHPPFSAAFIDSVQDIAPQIYPWIVEQLDASEYENVLHTNPAEFEKTSRVWTKEYLPMLRGSLLNYIGK